MRRCAPAGGVRSLRGGWATVQLSLMNAQFTDGRGRTVALSQSELTRLLQSLHSTEGLELVRRVAERMLQELI